MEHARVNRYFTYDNKYADEMNHSKVVARYATCVC